MRIMEDELVEHRTHKTSLGAEAPITRPTPCAFFISFSVEHGTSGGKQVI